MKAIQEINQLIYKIVTSLSDITECPEGWLPHTVWVEEESKTTGDPTFCQYMLEKIHPNGTCDLYNPDIGKIEHEGFPLNEINVEWLAILWERYIELSMEQQT